MDPNEALARLRAAMRQQADWAYGTAGIDINAAVSDAVEAFEALDDWLSRDGFLPEDWKAEEDQTPAEVFLNPALGPNPMDRS